ncbi:hypothetical protein Ae201684P_019773 [Aphanomyces euteiches]|nr:hypothetical protein Ae201684P_019773 [Aphanomyces euteiches]
MAAQPEDDTLSKKKRQKRTNYGSYLPVGPSTRTYCITLAYDGRAYGGFQLQEDQSLNIRTVQSVVEDALRRTTGETIRIRAASRTDKGVHALGQLAAFASAVQCDDANDFLRALNNRLPEDVATAISRVADDFDPRQASKFKCYVYKLRHGGIRRVLGREQLWQQRTQCGRHETSCSLFAKRRSTGLPHVYSRESSRQIQEHALSRDQSDRFLYRMVRNIVGVLVDVGLGKLSSQQVEEMVTKPTKPTACTGAPPHGLVLKWIQLKDEPSADTLA